MIRGRLTEVSRSYVGGWAVDTKDPERPLLVRIDELLEPGASEDLSWISSLERNLTRL